MKMILSTALIAAAMAAGFATSASATPNNFAERYFETLQEDGGA